MSVGIAGQGRMLMALLESPVIQSMEYCDRLLRNLLLDSPPSLRSPAVVVDSLEAHGRSNVNRWDGGQKSATAPAGG